MIDLQSWIDAEDQPDRKRFRQAVQLILRAIALSPSLSPVMVMKGGILLAIRYHSTRFTRDIDFSTSQRFQDVDVDSLLGMVGDALAPISADNEHALALRLQSHEVKPPNRPDVSFPTLTMRIGYASRLEPNSLKRLTAPGGSPHVVQVDYSFNEWASETEKQSVDGGSLSMYAFNDLVAEKIRSVLQQPIRRRERYQDIYDLFLLLDGNYIDQVDREAILGKLAESCRDRGVPIHVNAMRAPDVIEPSRRQYQSALASMVSGDIPPFETAYLSVQTFFESLPWDNETPNA